MTNIKTIEELVQQELEFANSVHPQFASDHEAWAVIKEELEECQSEIYNLNSDMQLIWCQIRNDKSINEWLTFAKRRAMNLAAEAIQVAAMCEKGMARYDHKED